MAEQKTKPTGESVASFLDSVEHEGRRKDGKKLLKMMREITGEKGKMWGPSMVGFGSYHYRYESGHEGDAFITGFSPRKSALTIYIMPGFEKNKELMAKLGKYRTGKSCLYINKLDDVDTDVLRELIESSVEEMGRLYPEM